MKFTFTACEALYNHSGILVQQNTHNPDFKLFTTFVLKNIKKGNTKRIRFRIASLTKKIGILFILRDAMKVYLYCQTIDKR